MSVLYGTSFQYSDGELRKNQDFMDLNPQNYYDNLHHHQQNQHNSGLSRYRSAPSSFFDSLVTGTNGVSGNGGEDYRFFRSSNLEMDTILERFMSSDNGSGGSNSHGLQEFEGDRPAAAIKQEVTDSDMVFQQSFQARNLSSMSGGNSLDRPFGVVGLEGSMNSVQATKLGSANGSNLVRQSSSSSGFFSNLGVDNGFSAIRDVGSFKASNGTNGETSPSPTRLSSHVSFSSGPRFLPQIGDESIGATSPDAATRKRQYMSSFQNDSWDDASLNSPKRIRDNEGNMFSGLGTLDNQNANSRHHVTGLTHHLSLPKTVSEMATMEKFLQFQGSVPCKIRAKRGCATHPRSIAERVRRTRISERMRKLQDLFPNMDKQTNTADMLELAVEYIKDLQNQVKALTDTKARCTCSSTHKPYSSASA